MIENSRLTEPGATPRPETGILYDMKTGRRVSKGPPLCDAAHELALAGFRVFPVQPGGKAPAGDVAPHGHRDATSSLVKIDAWWAQEDFNIGLTLAPKLLAIDIDPRDGGDVTFAALAEELGDLPETVEAITGGGGCHYIFKAESDIEFVGTLGPGVDVKHRGYVVVAPSVHSSGATYKWKEGRGPGEVEPAELPGPWRERMARTASSAAMAPRGDVVSIGGRHTHLVSRAGVLARTGIAEEAIEAAIRAENEAKCDPPIDDRELRDLIRDARGWVRKGDSSEARVQTVTADLGTVRPLRWLWQHWFLMGSLNLMVGAEGVGKSTIIAKQIAQASRGTLEGDLEGVPVDSIVIGAEDSFSRVWTPRLHMAGADLSRVHHVTHGIEGITIPDDIEALRSCIIAKDAKIVYFDQILDNLSGTVDEWKAKPVRKALIPLIALAAELDFALIVTLHRNKSNANSFRQTVSGSHAFSALARVALLVAAHPDGPEELRVLARGKGNYSRRPESLEFRIEDRRPEINGRTIETSVATDFKRCGLTPDDLLCAPRTERHSKAEMARRYIADQLADGARHAAKPIYDELEKMGISKSAIGEARVHIGAEQEKSAEFQGGNLWWMPAKAQTAQIITDGVNK